MRLSKSGDSARRKSHLGWQAKLLAGVSLAAGSLVVAGASAGPAAARAKPINILAINDTSGYTKVYGTQENLGLEAGAAYVNAHGGILGHKVVVTTVNDNGDPATAASVARQQLSSNPGKYTMVWAGSESITTAAIAPILKTYNVLSFASTDGSNECAAVSACPRLFIMFGNNGLPEVADSSYFVTHKIKKVGLLAEGTNYTEAELTYIQHDLARAGIKTVTTTFPPTAVSVTSEMQSLQSAGVQSVMALVFGTSAGYVLGARSTLGWKAPLVFDSAGSTADLPTLAPTSQLQGVSETATYCQNGSSNVPAWGKEVAYAPSHPIGEIPCEVSGPGWDSILFLKDAAEKANSLSQKALLSAVQSLKEAKGQLGFNFVTFQGYCFSHTNHQNVCNTASDFQVVPVGKLVNSRLHPLGS